MVKRIFTALLGMTMILSLAVGCTGSPATPPAASSDPAAPASQTESTTAPAEKVYKIGVTTQAWKHEFLKNMVNALQQKDKDMPNVELLIVDSEDSVEKQLNDVDTLIAQGVDGIILNALSFEGSSPAVDACVAANIPVVELVSYTENDKYQTFVGTNVKSSGVLAANIAAELLEKKGNVFELQGIIGHTAQINRGAGITETLATFPDLKLVESQSGEFDKDKSMAVTEAWLAKYPAGEIDVIIAHNDGMALGAMNACISANRPEIKIIGIDGDAEALQSVINGTLSATVLDYCEQEAQLAVDEMVSILGGSPAKKEIISEYIPIKDKAEATKFLEMRS